jgi:hypothetical protein
MDVLRVDVLTADTRDPPEIAAACAKLGPEVSREFMSACDYGSVGRIGKSWGIERKEANDFLSCLTDGSLYTQMLKMTQQEEIDVLFLLPEGQIVPANKGRKVRTQRGKREWDYKAVYHAWVEITCLGIHILPFVPKEYTPRAIVNVFHAMNGNLKYIVEKNRRPLTLANRKQPGRRFFEPVVGAATLHGLAEPFPNLWMLFGAVMEAPEDVLAIPGVGPTTLQKIRAYLTSRL